MINRRTYDNNKKTLILSSTILAVIVCLSFMSHFFIYAFSSTIYLAALATMVVLYIISKPITIQKGCLNLLLLCFLLCMFVSYFRSERLLGTTFDVVTIALAAMVVIFFNKSPDEYDIAIKCVDLFAIFFAVGVILNFFVPDIFRGIVSILPSSYSNVVKQQMSNYITGFSTNPGFSAGYIITGIVSLFAKRQSSKSSKIILALLIFALMLTGKRGPAIALIFTLLLCTMVTKRGSERIEKYCKWFIGALGLFALFLLFQDFLVLIPVVGEISGTISNFLLGEDVSSGRSKLYIWAIQLFLQSPLLGIGWGNFKTTVVGHATLVKELDVHNIYLQLLCETGVLGFLITAVMFFAFWNQTRKLYKFCANSTSSLNRSMLKYAYFSFAYQTYFLLYGLSGNVLYDQHYQIMYMFSCAITATLKYKLMEFGEIEQ